MRRALNILAVGLLVLVVLGGAFAGYLATSNTPPLRRSEGWLRVKSIPFARGETAAAVVEQRSGGPRLCPKDPCPGRLVYVVGGLGGALGRTTDAVGVFDPPANAWRDGPPLPEPRHHLAAAAIDDTLYVTGGSARTSKLTPEPNVWVLRPGHRSFQRLASMPEGRVAHAMVAHKGKIYVVAGRGPTSRVLIFTPGSGWKTGAAMPSPRDHAAAVVLQDKIFVIGGRSKGVTARVDVYDIATDAWAPGPDLPQPNSAMAAAVLQDGLLHVVGGEDPKLVGGSVHNVHLVLISDAWLEGPRPLLAVHGTPGLSVDGRMLIVGGSRRQGTFSVLGWTGMAQVFDPSLLLPGASPSPTPQRSPSPRPSSPRPSSPRPSG